MATPWGVCVRCVVHRATASAGSMLLSNVSAEVCVEKRDMRVPRSGSDDTVQRKKWRGQMRLREWCVPSSAELDERANEGRKEVRSRSYAM